MFVFRARQLIKINGKAAIVMHILSVKHGIVKSQRVLSHGNYKQPQKRKTGNPDLTAFIDLA